MPASAYRLRLTCIMSLLFPAQGTGALLINEILYDPEGPDRGYEFVELMNTGPYSAPLDGVEIEMGNGARPSDWKTIWRARDGTWLEPGGFYTVGAVGPGRGDPSEIALQNGPDGVRLVRSGFVLDRVGWGDLVHAEYAEGRPAPSVHAGRSLARKEDGRDTDDNRSDFEEAAPSPGRPNRPRHDWAVRILAIDPERPRPGEEVVLRIRWSNLGESEAICPAVDLRSDRTVVEVRPDRTVAAGSSIVQPVLLSIPDRQGRGIVRCSLRAADEIPENDSDSLRFSAGPAALRISEILADPGAGGSEWIEIAFDPSAAERGVLDGSEEWSFDLRGRRIRFKPRAAGVEKGIALLAEDSILVRNRFADLPSGLFWPYEGSWSRLRNDDGGHGISDSLRLRAPDCTVEEIALPGRAPASGISLERLDGDLPEGPGAWVPCADPAGATPGRISPHLVSSTSGADAVLSIEPRHLRAGATTCSIEGRVGIAAGKCDLTLVDLTGRTVRCLLRDVWASGILLATWDGRDETHRPVPPGIYVAHLSVDRGRGEPEHHRAALAVSE